MTDLTRELLLDIDDTTRAVFDLGTRHQAEQKEGSRRKAYERGIQEVREIAGDEHARILAAWIQTEIRTTERFPSARSVRKEGARICRDNGHEVSTGSWLGA